MTKRTHRRLTGMILVATALAPATLLATPASAFPKGDPVYTFKYKIVATTHIKRSDTTMTTPPGVFKGGIDLANGQLKGTIALPDVVSSQSLAGPLSLTVTTSVVSTKPVTGHVNIGTLKVTSTSTFNIHIKSMYVNQPSLPVALPIGLPVPLPLPPLPQVNLVGDGCTTSSPISVTMSGKASFDKPSTFKGVFSIPDFTNCGAMTEVINQQIPGPDNAFQATASPM
jgi:hypothetical protein